MGRSLVSLSSFASVGACACVCDVSVLDCTGEGKKSVVERYLQGGIGYLWLGIRKDTFGGDVVVSLGDLSEHQV